MAQISTPYLARLFKFCKDARHSLLCPTMPCSVQPNRPQGYPRHQALSSSPVNHERYPRLALGGTVVVVPSTEVHPPPPTPPGQKKRKEKHKVLGRRPVRRYLPSRPSTSAMGLQSYLHYPLQLTAEQGTLRQWVEQYPSFSIFQTPSPSKTTPVVLSGNITFEPRLGSPSFATASSWAILRRPRPTGTFVISPFPSTRQHEGEAK